MNSKLAFVLGLAIGGAVGAVVSYRVTKDKYQKIADEEIASMREVLAKQLADKAKADESANLEPEQEPKQKRVVPEEYIQITKKYTNGEELTVSKDQRPYVITPDEFGDHDDYDTQTLIYYEDGVLADYDGEVIENVGETVGADSLTHFDEDENDPDTVYVRNDILKYDYEILRDPGKFSEVIRADNSDDTEE